MKPFVAGVTSAVYNEMMGATEENQKAYIEKYYNMGVNLDLWWMDAGWYEKRAVCPPQVRKTGATPAAGPSTRPVFPPSSSPFPTLPPLTA